MTKRLTTALGFCVTLRPSEMVADPATSGFLVPVHRWVSGLPHGRATAQAVVPSMGFRRSLSLEAL